MPAEHVAPDRESRVYLTTLRHELRAPISAIIGYSELLSEDLAGSGFESVLRDIDRIRSAGRTLLELVDELFDPAAIATGRLDLARVGAHLRHELRTPLNHVIGYAELIAEEAQEDGSQALVTDMGRIRESAARVLEMIEHVLGPSSERTPESSGTEAADGLSSVATGVVQDLEAFGASGAPVPADRQRGRVLIVDDNELNRDMLARRVRGLGHEVEVAANGEEALDAARKGDFEVILLDLVMPGMNGYEVLRRLKAERETRGVPVIMISALDEVGSAVRCIELGAEDYLPKPFNLTLLRARLGTSLEKKRLRDREALHLHEIEEERRRADELLHVIFPDAIVRELKETRAVRPKRFEDVAVLFTDVVGFTRYAEGRDPEEVIFGLQRLVQAHEELTAEHGMEKIKTVGDAFLAAAGLLEPAENPVLSCVRCGLAMIEAAYELPPHWDIRVGVHVGPLVGGVLGRRQYLYDVIGDTVNTAARVEKHGVPGAVTMSRTAWLRIADLARAESLGTVQMMGEEPIGLMRFVAFT